VRGSFNAVNLVVIALGAAVAIGAFEARPSISKRRMAVTDFQPDQPPQSCAFVIFGVGFKMSLGLKDIRLALAAAGSLLVPMPLACLYRPPNVEPQAHR
jgi:3-hydroxyisobutyrate dehydrogenase-like beta-hydroxyacid dehydrogenase